MYRSFLLLIVIAGSVSFTFAQQLRTPNPVTGQAPVSQRRPVEAPTSTTANKFRTPNGTLSPEQAFAVRQARIEAHTRPLYRKPTEIELAAIAPDADLLDQYRQFLDGKNTGIFKLVPDSGCAGNSNIVVVSDNCLKYTMPGSGSSFSFRTGNYRIRHLADLTLSDGVFRIPGIMMIGIIAKLGDVPIESVSLQTRGLKTLTEFEPSDQYEQAKAIGQNVVKGLKHDGFVYSRSTPASDNSTYAMRVVAFDGKVMRSVPGASYNEMDFDRRRDVVVAFRVVRRDSDGSLTIVWTELRDVDSPKLKIPETVARK